ncbi:hypothetical protein BC332_26020 [Capsicum chinense]|nr:hypothetical protein BC332_26020 [Capsicum chinense]
MENERLDRMVGQREQVRFPDIRQEEGRSSCELQGKNTIPCTPMNLVCCVVASRSQVGVVAALPRVEVLESSFCDTLGDVRSWEEQSLDVSTQALVDPLDDEIDSSLKNNLCPSSASPYNLSKTPLPINEGIHTLVDPCVSQGESMLVYELPITSEDVNEDQLTQECIPLLEHMCGVLEKSQVSDDVYRVDLDGAHDSLIILCGKSLASSFVHRDHVYGNVVNNSICLFEVGLLGHISLFLNISLLLKGNVMRDCGSDILWERKVSLSLDPWLLLPFDPGTLSECGNIYTYHLILGQDDKQCFIVGANEGRQGSSLPLFVDDDLFLCAIYTKILELLLNILLLMILECLIHLLNGKAIMSSTLQLTVIRNLLEPEILCRICPLRMKIGTEHILQAQLRGTLCMVLIFLVMLMAPVGNAPRAHVAMYKVCYLNFQEFNVLAGLDVAIEDGVDVISISLGLDESPPLYDDYMVVGVYSAMEKGIFVSFAAGNDGPGNGSIVNGAQWILTVGTSTIDRKISAVAVLGNGAEYEGESACQPTNFSQKLLPLMNGNDCDVLLNLSDVLGKIVLCDTSGYSSRTDKGGVVKNVGSAGMILMTKSLMALQLFQNIMSFP